MRRHRILSILSTIAVPLITTVCGEPGAPPAASRTADVAVPPPELAITDSRDDDGIAHFFFLEPVDRRPKGRRLGPADRSLEGSLALEICQWMGDHCAQPLLARYTKTSGVGKERLQLDDDDDYYKVRWYTSRFSSVDAGETYRITVLAAGIALGSADVKIVRKNKDAKKVDRDDYVVLKDDEGLTIRFYIERCGVFVIPATGGSATPCTSGSVIATANQAVGIIVPSGAAVPDTKYTVTPIADAPSDAGLAGGPFAFTPSGVDFSQPVTLSMSFASAKVPSRIPENTLGAYELKDGAWRRAAAATIDADHDRADFDIAHFSQYAVLAPVASVALAMPATPLTVGGSANAIATVKDAADRVLEHRLLEWSVFPAGIVSVDANGKLTGLGAGEATVTVTSEGVRTAASMTVGSAKAASVVIGGGSDAPLIVGQTRQLSATAHDATGAVISGGVVTWSSSSDANATVDATGLVTAKAPGTATITATVDGVSGSSLVTVQPLPVTSVAVTSTAIGPLDIGATRQLTASVYNGATQLLGRTVTWASSDANVAAVDANGLVTAKARGSATISATSEGIVGTIDLTIQLPPITSVAVTPSASTILVGATQQLAAAAMAGTVAQSGRAVAWTSSNDAIATVDANGLVTGKAPGDATISATVEGISGSANVTVNPLPVTSVVVASVAGGPLNVGGTRQLTASAYNGTTPLTGRTIAWSSSDQNIAAVDASGLVTGRAVGAVTISATVEGVAGTIDITVQLPPITSVVVTPPSSTILVGATQQLSAAAMAGSVPQSGRAVTWQSSDEAIASVDANGLVTGNAPGDATISATVEGITGSAAVSVNPLPATSVVVSATESGPLNVGATRQLTAGVFNGTTQLVGRAVTWSSSSADVMSVDAAGLVTAKAPGNATITATAEGVSGSLDLVAQLPPITSVTVTPATADLIVGGTQQFSATALAGTVAQSGRAVTWASSNDAVVTIGIDGLAIAKGAGTADVTATVDGVAGSATVSVKLPPVTAVNVTPQSATIFVGATQQLAAVAMSGADPQPGRAVAWASSNDAVATVDGNGLVTARAPGAATVSATVDGISGGSSITVNPVVVPVTSVVVSSPAIGPLAVGSTRQLTAAAYSGTTQLFGRAVAWSSSDPNTMTVDGNGLVTAVSAGRATITALVDGVGGSNDISTQGLVFGPWRMGVPQLASLFSGSLRELKPVEGIALLDSARAAGLRLIITPVSGRSNFKDPITGRFDLQLWKYQLDRFNGVDFTPYIRSGTIIGIFIIDEPMDPTNWVNKNACMTDGVSPTCLTDANGAIIPDPGEPVSYADIDAAAAYAKNFFPGVPMGVGSRPSELEPGAPFQNLNFGFAQYTTKKKDASGKALTASGFVTYEVAAAKRAGLGTILSINVLAGNGGAEVLPSQLRSWGTVMANEPYACALTMWKWDFTDGTSGERYNTFWTDPTIIAALRDVAAVAGKRPPGSCWAH